ncbi:Ca2+-binding RTX toxin-like protein [Brevundimonas alba]|uniref:Ca2+-binding RTX toxin-like protein n=1 Tax=Brevundimonas alba TaxID=74314 RepID=A0A7X6BN38_9CAUL|nr:calcium-binding protein [Brevundimonas alba]NJC40310.1 Ca2+-binding RTX toxin-like protein [Brevundimonas alba]
MSIHSSLRAGKPDTFLFVPVVGDSGDNTLPGTAGDDTIDGLDGDDTLSGGGGVDVMDGGLGSDTADYTTAAAGVVVRLFAGQTTVDGDGGTDTLISIENVTGSAFNDTLLGTVGNNVLSGGAGQDFLIGLGGDDILIGGSVLANQLQGGIGDDDYYVSANDTLVEFAGEGHDRIFTTQARLVMAANIEDLTYTGSGAFTGIGNAEDNAITGNIGADVLSGREGADSLDGGDGIDTVDYRLAGSGVVLSLADGEASDDGDGSTDILANFENVTGSVWDDDLTGDAGVNVLDGGDGYDRLVGGGGADILRGGADYDMVDYSGAAGGVFIKLNTGQAVNDGDGSSDQLISIEDVTGSAFNDIIIGGSIDNYLYGGAGSDVLIGLDGDDLLEGGNGAANQLQGGLGDDRYYVEANDTLVEFANEGHDSVLTTRNSYTLRANFEDLAFDGVGNFVGTGNDEDNAIVGGDGDDFLTGLKGDDILVGASGCGCGGGGNDTAVMSGVLADYEIEDLGGGAWGITDLVADRDGSDLLLDIDQLRFSDGSTYALVSVDPAPVLSDKTLDIAQVLPGLIDDDFLSFKDVDGPLVLPGDDGQMASSVLLDAELIEAFPTHMLTLSPEGGYVGGTDDIGRLHDHDGWLF